jgi:proline iminopeptidase
LALLPGGPGVAAEYLHDVAALVDRSMMVVIVEPRGHGRSDHRGPYEVADLIADVDAVRAALGHERWYVGGHSFGADLALAYGLEHPERTLGIAAIAPNGLQDDREWHRRYEAGHAAGLDPLPDPEPTVDPETHAAALASWRRYIKRPDLLRRVADMPVPSIAIVGTEDVRPAWPVEQLAALAPHGRVEVFQGAGHYPWWTHADAVARVMRSIVA